MQKKNWIQYKNENEQQEKLIGEYKMKLLEKR